MSVPLTEKLYQTLRLHHGIATVDGRGIGTDERHPFGMRGKRNATDHDPNGAVEGHPAQVP